MKKISILALAALMAAPAFAAAPVANNAKASDAQLSQPAQMNLTVSKAQKVQNAPAKAVSSIDDLCTFYNATYIYGLKGDDKFGGSLQPQILKGEGANEVIIRGFPYSDVDLVATVDLSARTITLVKQDIMFMPDENEMMVFQPEVWNDAGDQILTADKMVGTIGNDGTITFPETACWSIRISKGWYFMGYNIKMTPLNFFTFNEAEWTKLEGDAQMTDHILNNFLQEQYQVTTPVNVPCYVKKGDNNIIALRNPYKQGAWNEVNVADELGKGDGFIVFSIENPDCVVTTPLTGCGFWINNGEENAPVWEDCFPYNEEGEKYYFQGYTFEDIIDEFGAIDVPVSSYNESTRTVSIVNMWFGISSDPTGKYGFAETKNPDGTVATWKPLSYEIVLPSMTGINDVEMNENAPVRYYNLQGMEVVNPVKGQLVIKTQGNKAQKVIVK